MKLTYVNNLGITPARVNRETGEIFLNARVWDSLPEGFKKFILAHEEGHYKLQTTSELEADKFAFEKLAGTFKNSLKTCVNTLADVLPFTTDSHTLRLYKMYQHALKYQADKYGDEATKKELQRITSFINQNLIYSDMIGTKETNSSYEYTGLEDLSLYDPSMGRWFHSIPLSVAETFNNSHDANKKVFGGTPYTITGETKQNTVQNIIENQDLRMVSLDEIPDYKIVYETDRNIVIIGLALIVFILLLLK